MAAAGGSGVDTSSGAYLELVLLGSCNRLFF
jgi:hypothetical protein